MPASTQSRVPYLNGLPVEIPTEPIWKLTVKQYHKMLETGILNWGDPIELLEGYLVPKLEVAWPEQPQAANGSPGMPIYRLSVEQYHEMIKTGILPDGTPVELLEGWLVKKMGKNPPHTLATQKTKIAIDAILPSGFFARAQDPVTIELSEPEPDVSVARGKLDDYANRHPYPADIPWLTEVADSSLKQDRGSKKRLYARARIPIYWIINLIDHQVEVYSEPIGSGMDATYKKCRIYKPGDQVPVVIRGKTVGRIPVVDLLP